MITSLGTVKSTVEPTRKRKLHLAFVLFAAAILFSMVREWNAPVSCARVTYLHSTPVGR